LLIYKPLLVRRVVGESMLPNLKPGQIVVGWKSNQFKVGDIVIIRHDNLEKIKRVGKIEGRKIYVFGDNVAASTDSRQFGYIDQTQIIGRIIWPLTKAT
jgi:nickel-type superoxide dismutase maturation protease